MFESSTTPEVFHDTVTPSEAPAAIPAGQGPDKAAERTQAVIARYEERKDELAKAAETQPTPDVMTATVTTAESAATAAQQQLEKAKSPDGPFANLLIGLRGKQGIADKLGSLLRAQTSTEATKQAVEAAREDQKAAQMYTPDYLKRQSDEGRVDELIHANALGGPQEVTPGMTEALNEQARIKENIQTKQAREEAERAAKLENIGEQLQFYEKMGVSIAPEDILPAPIFRELLDVEDWKREKAEKDILVATSFNEAAMDYADNNNVPIDNATLVNAYKRGLAFQGVDTRGASEFRARKVGVKSSNELRGHDTWYAFGAVDLDRFFTKEKVPPDLQTPYVIAYSAGVAIRSPHADNQQNFVRDWIADTLPVDQPKTVRKDGEWVEETVRKPLGIGSFLSKEHGVGSADIKYKGSEDKSVVTALNEAGKIVRGIHNNLVKNRVAGMPPSFRPSEIYNVPLVENKPQ